MSDSLQWRNLGKIFDPAEHALPNPCFGFAQGPQALVLDESVRIYFSTREKDSSGKYISHIAYADFDYSFSHVLSVSTHEVIKLGELGAFDEHGIFPIHVTKLDGQIIAYTTGWNRKISVPADASIGYALSEDNGKSFKKYGTGPIVSSSLHEPFLVGDPCVRAYGGQFHMWYIFGTRWIESEASNQPERVYKIAHATSQDGINWTRNSITIIPDVLGADECQAYPTIFSYRDRYHMYFCYRAAVGFRKSATAGYRLGYAHSTDLENWYRADELAGETFGKNGWDEHMQCYPSTFTLNNEIYLLYNGNEFGRNGFGLAKLIS